MKDGTGMHDTDKENEEYNKVGRGSGDKAGKPVVKELGGAGTYIVFNAHRIRQACFRHPHAPRKLVELD